MPTVSGSRYRDRNTVDGNPLDLAHWAFLSQDQFTGGALDTTAWSAYDNSTFGAPSRVQRYMAYNAVVGPGSTGSTGGTSLKLMSKRETVGAQSFTAGMLDSKTAGQYYPRYCRMEARMKLPHGQGLWPAWWLTAKNGGATMAEMDAMEYFHSQVPGKLTSTLHRTNNAGTFQANVSKASTFFEAPTYSPGWHTVAIEISPTDVDPTSVTSNVQFRAYIDGVNVWSYLDTQALYWTTNGGDENNFWNVYLQGCQIDGNYVGDPDDALGYGHWLNNCLISGTPPNSCATASGGYSVIRAGAAGATATFSDPATTFEIDYHRVWKWTG